MLFNFKLFSRIYYALSLLIVVILSGTIGFMLVEDYNFVEAFYMTIITVSTVGFSEVRELSLNGRIFTSALIITSFGIFAYAVSSITTYLIDGEYKAYFRDYKVLKTVEQLSGHTIVCGFGRVGSQAVRQLKAYGQSYVVIEGQEELVNSFKENKEYNYIQGDATTDENLIKAGILKAKSIITTLPSDADNVFVVLTAKELNPNINVISRASKESSVKKLKMAGADNVIMPDSLGGAHMASLIVTPDVMEFLDNISIQGESGLTIESIAFDNIPDKYKNKAIGELDRSYSTGCTIIGFKSPGGEYIINPSSELIIAPNSKLIVLGNPAQIKKLNDTFGIENPA